MQRILWIAIVSLFTSTILDRLKTFMGLASGFVEINPAQAWVLAHSPWFFYSTAFITPTAIGLIMMIGFRFLEGPQFQLHRRFLASLFLGLSMFSWTPVLHNTSCFYSLRDEARVGIRYHRLVQ
ncbi:hypothetical protein AUI06_01130 [archaeon 13_2_20CM_2_52_21]|nr:MAG: hypothetical protein AUI06_01130 [archaeon 13_2_20CM_2_52_21]